MGKEVFGMEEMNGSTVDAYPDGGVAVEEEGPLRWCRLRGGRRVG